MRMAICLGLLLSFTSACSSSPKGGDARPADAARAAKPIPTVEELALTSPPETCMLQDWEDGDTPTVLCGEDGQKVVIRMLGIDTAESGFDENSRRRAQRQVEQWGMSLEQVYACGKAATRLVKQLCPPDSPVEVIGSERGKYGRRLAYVLCDGVNLNLRLVEAGLAGRYPYPAPPEKPAGCPLPLKP